MSEQRHRLICDCGRPTVVRLGSAWVCAVCFEIDSMRLKKERERRARERRARRSINGICESTKFATREQQTRKEQSA